MECPKCNGEIKSKKIEQERWLLSCSKCEICFTPDNETLTLEESHKRLKELFKKGVLANDGMTWIRKHGLGKKLKALNSGIEEDINFDDLPPTAKSIIRGKDKIAKYKKMEATSPEKGVELENLDLNSQLKSNLKSEGINSLFKFQEKTIEKIRSGQDLIISAPTATGKTESFILPIFQDILETPNQDSTIKAILIYPTKTLSRDQLKKLKTLANGTEIKIDVYDGDTGKSERERIVDDPPEILITNFDMIHYHLSRNTEFSNLVKTSEYIVVDETHQYTGLFGSNVRFIIERLRRVSEKNLQIIGASATIRNPKGFGEKLFGTPVEKITCSEGRHGPIHFFMAYPKERSANTMLVDILNKIVRAGKKSILFGNSHKGVESMKMIAGDKNGMDIEVHRSGLNKKHRKNVVEKLREGKLKSVVSTPTLELGIDIGNLDAIISMIVGITQFKQRIGRVARRGQEGLAVLGLRNNDPISAYYSNHPKDYFRDIDPAYCEPKNPVVATHQLISAAMDKPITYREFPDFKEILDELERENLLKKKNNSLLATKKGRKKIQNFSIRGIGETIRIYHDDKKIGTRQMPIALRELHPGAIYLHGGKKYRSTSFMLGNDSGKAELEKINQDYKKRTEPSVKSSPEIIEVKDEKQVHNLTVKYCNLKISEIVDGYYSIDIFKNEVSEEKQLENPIEYSFNTQGLVFKAPAPNLNNGTEMAQEEKLTGSFHAVEHSLIESSDMITGGGSDEMAGIAMGNSGIIFAYDGVKGGSGITRLLYKRFKQGIERAYSILNDCDCKNKAGCPNCTFSYNCGNNNEPLHKTGAIESLTKIKEGKETKIPKKDFSTLESLV